MTWESREHERPEMERERPERLVPPVAHAPGSPVLPQRWKRLFSYRRCTMIRRLVGLILMLLGVAGLVLSVVGVVAIWQVRAEAAERADKLAKHAEELLGMAAKNLQDVG